MPLFVLWTKFITPRNIFARSSPYRWAGSSVVSGGLVDQGPGEIEAFITRWQASGGAERANYALFLTELCDILRVPRPDAATGGSGPYRFERSVARHERDGSTSTRRIDLYKRGCFVLEAKQASDRPQQPGLFGTTGMSEAERRATVRQTPGWAQAMLKAKGQAENYARDLPVEEGWPPIIMVCDVGFCIDVFADFSGTGKHYAQFPDQKDYRIYLTELRDPATRDRLRSVWIAPLTLDPSKRRVEVTQEIAALLARLAIQLEARKHTPEAVATFLMRTVFSMFAQSVGLLPSKTAFTDLLEVCHAAPPSFVPLVGDMWRTMDKGGFSPGMRANLRRFNGGLFAPGPHGPVEPLPLDADMIDLLVIASKRDWSQVEPAIFGTLLENAINKRERDRLGAHFTPRAFVERLIQPTLMDPLLTEWDGVKASALHKAQASDIPGAADAVRSFHARLCAIRVLDPACGTANFLYVALDLLKRLEGEVLDLLADLVPGEGERFDLTQATVDPHQFLGLEVNPRAVPVAELVLWLGWLQWHFRNRPGRQLPEPILRDFRNIQHMDALLDYQSEEVVQGATRWGGRTKLHSITSEEVPDENDRMLVMRPKNAKPTKWPEADFIIGNPPFIAGKDLRTDLGDGYAEALWDAYPKLNRSADLALFFWWKAAQATTSGQTRRFGLITSNSLRQVFCRRVVADAMTARVPLHLVFAVPDHPWSVGAGSAAVRIAMTVAEAGEGEGLLSLVVGETQGKNGVPAVTFVTRTGHINADLTIGTNVKAARPLRANGAIASPGVKLHGAGFIVSPTQAKAMGLGKMPGLEQHIRPYLNGRDLQQRSRGMMVIDLFGLAEDDVRHQFGAVWQHVHSTVKPQRDAIAGNGPDTAQYAREWWLFGKTRPELRAALRGLDRYIATVETAKHRAFTFLPAGVLPDNMLIAVGSDDAFHLGVLSSRIHTIWFMATCGWLGVGNDPRYNKTQCFDPFPFPNASSPQRAEIAAIAEELDSHRKARIVAHPHLTLTRLYNVLVAIRAGTPLSPEERDIHDAGQVTILRALHDRLDATVADAYGWLRDLSEADVVAQVVALNAERVAEEAKGKVRWLRPAYQAPADAARAVKQTSLVVDQAPIVIDCRWPKDEPAQFVALRTALRSGPIAARDLARGFKGVPRGDRVPKMLATLVALGQARALDGGRYTA
jgi:hypothetical protein